MKAIYEVNVKHDFPDGTFEVSFADRSDLDVYDYELTFWEADP
jgi:hypothetical protein